MLVQISALHKNYDSPILPKLLNSVAGFQGRANDIVGALCNVNAGSNQPAQFKVFIIF